ncbi:MAG: uroporphyrinogen-III synthase [Acidobacteriota bacterium]|nr:uroporphyrinogen-III synthase [Blastocatellia bacterium]MDW8411959.1 uroporphyrinogen-III synthase [Acidobacteriota bacterium]
MYVLLTGTKRQDDPLASILTAAGAIVAHCPMVKIVPPQSYTQLDKALRELESYDWALFTSRYAVESCIERLAHLSLSFPSRLSVLAVGRSTAKILFQNDIKVSLMPEIFNAEAAVSALLEKLESVKGLKFFFPRSAQGRETLIDRLSALGAYVHFVEAYQTVVPEDAKTSLAKLLERCPDVVTFASPSAVRNLAELLLPIPLYQALCSSLIACIGPVTAAAVKEQGLPVDIVAEEASSEALAKAVLSRFTS